VSDIFSCPSHRTTWHEELKIGLRLQVAIPMRILSKPSHAVYLATPDGIIDRGISRFTCFPTHGLHYHNITCDGITHKKTQPKPEKRYHKEPVHKLEDLAY
jgi:hypothetical protein